MKTKDRLALYSVDELSKQLEDEARKCMRYGSRFPDCDFALISPDEVDMGIEHLSETASGWYGIKAFDPGFDSADLMLFFRLLRWWSGVVLLYMGRRVVLFRCC